MAKAFNSLEDLVRYVKKASADSIEACGKEMKEIMKDETQKQVYDAYNPTEYKRTKDLLNSVDIKDIDTNGVTVAWLDNGGWYSVNRDTYGDHMYAVWALENGKTWGKGHTPRNPKYRDSTNLVEGSKEQIKVEIPKTYKKEMKRRGIPIK